MSYWSQAQEDVECDFPHCGKEFDKTDHAKVAILKNGSVMAFCKEHASKLISEGVPLKSLEEIRAEREASAKKREADERKAHEAKFISDLKNPD